jgi:Rrf2 family protein
LTNVLSSKAKYAVRAALALAEEADKEGWTTVSEIAERESIPKKYLEAILVQLRDQGLIDSRRGPSGGHRLGVEASTIRVADIIRIIDGPLALTPCASRTQFRACDDCVDVRTCRLRHLMQRARDAAAAVLEGVTVADLVSMPKLAAPLRNGRRRVSDPASLA